jgi:hypothetical protein
MTNGYSRITVDRVDSFNWKFIYWVINPNPNRPHFMAYFHSRLGDSFQMMMVHDEPDLATSDDLIFRAEEHDYESDLVVQTRLFVTVPWQLVRPVVTELSDEQVRDIDDMFSGMRRPVNRTGSFVTSNLDLRWDLVEQQLDMANKFMADVCRLEPTDLDQIGELVISESVMSQDRQSLDNDPVTAMAVDELISKGLRIRGTHFQFDSQNRTHRLSDSDQLVASLAERIACRSTKTVLQNT